MNTLKLKKLKEILPLEYPKVPPVDNINNVGDSVLIRNLTRVEPEWDRPRNTVQMELMEATHDFELSKQHLDAVRNGNLLCKLDEQWQVIIEKEVMLKRSFQKFNKFVRENREKRERAEKKLTEERSVVSQRLENLRDLQKSFAHLHDVKHKMELKIKELKMYEDYLVSVTKCSGNKFKGVHDVIVRFESLKENKVELSEKQKNDLRSMERMNSALADLISEKNMRIVGHNNKIGELANRYDLAKAESLKWEAAVTHLSQLAFDKKYSIQSIRISCWNIYASMCARAHIDPATIDRNDIGRQMLFVKKHFGILKTVGRSVKRSSAYTTSQGTVPGKQSSRRGLLKKHSSGLHEAVTKANAPVKRYTIVQPATT